MPQPSLSRTILSRGLQYSSVLVQYGTLNMLICLFDKLKRLEAENDAAAATRPAHINEQWRQALAEVQLRLLTQLPDAQTVLVIVTKQKAAQGQQQDLLLERAVNVLSHYLYYQATVSCMSVLYYIS